MKMNFKKGILLLVIVGLFSMGYFGRSFLFEEVAFLKQWKKHSTTVKGVSSDFSEKYQDNIAFKKLILRNPDSPIKREDFGNFYARSRAAITIDSETNTILHYQNAKKRRPIASLTKIMTAVLVVEKIKDLKREIVTIDEDSVYEDGTKIGCPRGGYCVSARLQVGEKISAWNLFQAMVMNSTNDAAVALAKHIAGTEKEFVKMMNNKAREIGLSDTNFCNASGLDGENQIGECYSTAYDIARIANYSLKYDKIWDTMKINRKDIYSLDGKIKHTIGNTDRLLERMPNCLGGKTGFTYEAGKCLMSVAIDPNGKGHKVVGVLLDDYYRWQDMEKMLTWSFQAYQWKNSN